MDPMTVSAQFAAYTWFFDGNAGKPDAQNQAMIFARQNWQAFLGCAREGLGRFLIRIGRLGQSKAGRKRNLASSL